MLLNVSIHIKFIRLDFRQKKNKKKWILLLDKIMTFLGGQCPLRLCSIYWKKIAMFLWDAEGLTFLIKKNAKCTYNIYST